MNQDSGIIVSGAGIRSCQNISLKRLVHKTSTSEINCTCGWSWNRIIMVKNTSSRKESFRNILSIYSGFKSMTCQRIETCNHVLIHVHEGNVALSSKHTKTYKPGWRQKPSINTSQKIAKLYSCTVESRFTTFCHDSIHHRIFWK